LPTKVGRRELFRQLHTDDVIVEMMGERTIGIEAHVAMCRAYVDATENLTIRLHPIQFGAGEWTCGIGQLAGGFQMCTVAKWRDGKICEEYIFQGGVAGPTAD
jgi:hypothetical protein